MRRVYGTVAVSLTLMLFCNAALAEKHVTFVKKPTGTTTAIQGGTPSVSGNSTGRPRRTSGRPLSAYWLGLRVGPANATLRNQLHLGDVGLVVQEVFDGTPAKAAGFQVDDILVEAIHKDAHKPLHQLSDLVGAVNTTGPNDGPVQVRLLRQGQEQLVSATPAKRVQTP